MRLLLIEDEAPLARLLQRLLVRDRHIVEWTGLGQDGLSLASEGEWDMLILDIGLPDLSGFDVARRIREAGITAPILMLTARDAVESRVQGLDAGADDYLIKPFAYEELAARIRSLARRPTSVQAEGARPVGRISFDPARRCVFVDGVEINLTAREFALLECLVRNVGITLTRDQLLDLAWPFGAAVTPNTVDTYIHYLRSKLGESAGRQVETVWGAGYRLVSERGAGPASANRRSRV